MAATKNAAKDMKPRLRYVGGEIKAECAYAHMAGAVKYPELPEKERTGTGIINFMQEDPENVVSLSALLESIERHLDACKAGEDIDRDCTQRLGRDVSHLGCMAAGINMILRRQAAGVLTDDRPYRPAERQPIPTLDTVKTTKPVVNIVVCTSLDTVHFCDQCMLDTWHKVVRDEDGEIKQQYCRTCFPELL